MSANARQRGLKKVHTGTPRLAGLACLRLKSTLTELALVGTAVRRPRSAVSEPVMLMDNTPYTPPIGPNSAPAPSREIYARMGEANIFRMLADFYAELGGSSIRGMFPNDLQASSERSAMFFVGLLGGPPLYQQRYGAPMMRARHLPFPIDEAARRSPAISHAGRCHARRRTIPAILDIGDGRQRNQRSRHDRNGQRLSLRHPHRGLARPPRPRSRKPDRRSGQGRPDRDPGRPRGLAGRRLRRRAGASRG